MADSRREKLSAAKRKLKEFNKQKSQAKAGSPENDSSQFDKVPLNDSDVVNGTLVNGRKDNSAVDEHHKYGAVKGDAVISSSEIQRSTAPVYQPQENVVQLSRQVNGTVSSIRSEPDHIPAVQHSRTSDTAELEQKNRDLIAQVEHYMRLNEHLTRQLNDTRSQVQRLQLNLESDRTGFDEKLKHELGSLREQLQVHIQTIGILVAEKTELQSTVTQNQQSTEKLISERDELSGRLKASRQRVAELEKNLGSAVNSNQKLDKASKEMAKDMDRLKMDIYKLNKANEEFQQQVSELHGKLQRKVQENGKLDDDIVDLRGKLEMANLHLQQLQSGGEQRQADSHLVDQLTHEISAVQHKLSQAEDALRRMSHDKEQAVAQYQTYVDQMQAQSRQLQAQVNTLLNDKEHLLTQRHELENTVADLQHRTAADVAAAREALTLKQTLTDTVARLKQDLEQVTQLYNSQVADNGQLSRLVSEQEAMLEEQRYELQRYADSHVDHAALLDSMQADKTALSRATAQNRELKHQLEELQNGFVKMSNENMELMTSLQSEQHAVKELSARLAQQEEALAELRLQSSSGRFSQSSVSEADVNGHAEIVDALRTQLAAAQDTINTLTNQNAELRAHFVEQSFAGTSPSFDKQTEALFTAVKQLEVERNELMSQLWNEQQHHQHTHQQLTALQRQLDSHNSTASDSHVVTQSQFETLHHAMKQLEEKYMRVMKDKADLVERLETSEHQLLQLQGESDTIGEYVSLYQTQRSALRQRQVLNEEYIAKMAREREAMQDKLQTLQGLVVRLLGEKQQAESSGTTVSAPIQYTDADLAREHAAADKIASRIAIPQPRPAEESPDEGSSSDDEDAIDEEARRQQHKKRVKKIPAFRQSTSTPITKLTNLQNVSLDSVSEQLTQSPLASSETAQQIIHLLHEMGQSDASILQHTDSGVVQCANCQGPLLYV